MLNELDRDIKTLSAHEAKGWVEAAEMAFYELKRRREAGEISGEEYQEGLDWLYKKMCSAQAACDRIVEEMAVDLQEFEELTW